MTSLHPSLVRRTVRTDTAPIDGANSVAGPPARPRRRHSLGGRAWCSAPSRTIGVRLVMPIGLGLMLLLGACGSDGTDAGSENAGAANEGTASDGTGPDGAMSGDAVLPEGWELADPDAAPANDGDTPGGIAFSDEAIAAASADANDSGVEPDSVEPAPFATPPSAEPALPTPVEPPHELETIVLDNGPAGVEPSSDLDDQAALMCANVEFSLDAVIAGDTAAQTELLATAAEWGSQSGSGAVRALGEEFGAADVGDTEAIETLVVRVLTACTEQGYEL